MEKCVLILCCSEMLDIWQLAACRWGGLRDSQRVRQGPQLRRRRRARGRARSCADCGMAYKACRLVDGTHCIKVAHGLLQTTTKQHFFQGSSWHHLGIRALAAPAASGALGFRSEAGRLSPLSSPRHSSTSPSRAGPLGDESSFSPEQSVPCSFAGSRPQEQHPFGSCRDFN